MESNIILNTMNSINYDLKVDIKKIIESLKQELNNNFDLLLEANKIDINNNNGFLINKDTINNIFNLVLKEPYQYGDVILSEKDDKLNITYGKQISNIGTICTIFDGNTYTLLELLLRNTLVNNSNIFLYNNYMYGTNTYIIEILKEILKQNNIDSNMVNQIITDDYSTILSKTTSIDLVLCIGPKELQSTIIKQSNIKTIVSGYLYSEIYIDSLEHINTLETIMSNKKNITLYAKESLGIRNSDVIQVSDEDEAISVINNTGSRYSTSIFTNSSDIASKFLKEIKSKQVLINTSPTLENLLDINQKELYNEKTIIYPISNKTDDNRVEINI